MNETTFPPCSHKKVEYHGLHPSREQKGPCHILIMDDEDFIREVVGMILRTMGYSILEAKDGREALELCAEAMERGQPISGALFDLAVPDGIGGKDAIVEFRKWFPDMPVFAASGDSGDPVMRRPTEFGFTDSICKPFGKKDLTLLFDKHLKTGRNSRALEIVR